MSNWATLKSDVADVIKANANQEITGTNNQQVLFEMIDVLGGAYLYKGLATSTTNPSNPDGLFFYITTTGGTYTNFLDATASPIVVTGDVLTIIKGTGNVWSTDEIDYTLGIETFLELSDTPSAYTSYNGYHVSVNSAGDGLEFTPAMGEGALTADYQWSTGVTATDPTSGYVKADDTTYGDITQIFISSTTRQGNDAEFMFNTLDENDLFSIINQNGDKYIVSIIDGTPVDNGTWWTIPVTVIYTYGAFNNNQYVNADINILPTRNFIDLNDTPTDYIGASGKLVAVKSTEDGVEFINPSAGGGDYDKWVLGTNELITSGTALLEEDDDDITDEGGTSVDEEGGGDDELGYNYYDILDDVVVKFVRGTGIEIESSRPSAGIYEVEISSTGSGSNFYLEDGSFNTLNGELTLEVLGSTDVVVDLDGRYLLSSDYENDIDYVNGSSFTSGTLYLTGVGNAGTSISLDGRYSLLSHTHSYDNYDSWVLRGTADVDIDSGDIVEFYAGADIGITQASITGGQRITIAYTGSSGGGVTNFLGLTDTPSAYTSMGGSFVRVNSATNALEFVAGDYDNYDAWTLRGSADVDIETGDVFEVVGGTDITVTQASITGGQKMTIDYTGSSGGATTFLGLTDTPSSYSGMSGRFAKVNSGATAIEFVDANYDNYDSWTLKGSSSVDIETGDIFEVIGGTDISVTQSAITGGQRMTIAYTGSGGGMTDFDFTVDGSTRQVGDGDEVSFIEGECIALAGRSIVAGGVETTVSLNSYPALYRATGSDNVVNTADTIISLDVEDFDPSGGYSLSLTTTGAIDIGQDGYYSISYTVPIEQDSTSGATRAIISAWVEIDGTALDQSLGEAYAREASGGGGSPSSTFLAQLSDGDELTLVVRSFYNIDVSTHARKVQLSIHKIG